MGLKEAEELHKRVVALNIERVAIIQKILNAMSSQELMMDCKFLEFCNSNNLTREIR